jgi:hypothetical protein
MQRHLYIMPRLAVALLVVVALLTSCSRKKNKDSSDESPIDYIDPPQYVPSTNTNLGLTQEANRLTPEQVSNHLAKALMYRHGWTNNETGDFYDILKQLMNVPLGGVDYVTANKRDTSAKVQTQLLVRTIAIQFAAGVVIRDFDTNDGSPSPFVFTSSDINNDRPMIASDASAGSAQLSLARASEARWEAQFVDIHWRLFSRAPTATEIADAKEIGAAVFAQEQWPPKVWFIILYALLSSAELWNI